MYGICSAKDSDLNKIFAVCYILVIFVYYYSCYFLNLYLNFYEKDIHFRPDALCDQPAATQFCLGR
jgi:hypothetical protein